MTETVHHFHDANLPGCGKDNLEQDLTLNLKLPPLVSVNRARLECDLSRQGFDGGFGGLGYGLRNGDDAGVPETTLADRDTRRG